MGGFVRPLIQARFALGRVYWKLNDSALAIQNYEHFIKLAQMADDVASTSEAAQHLLQVRQLTCRRKKKLEMRKTAIKNALRSFASLHSVYFSADSYSLC